MRRRLLLGVAAGTLILLSCRAARAAEKTFVGMPTVGMPIADWLQAANWDPAGIPTSDDDVTLGSSRMASLGSGTMIRNFTLDTGELRGLGTLTVLGHMSWPAGTMRGAPGVAVGITRVEGGLEMLATGTRVLNARSLELAGTSTISGPQTAVSFTNSTVDIEAGAVFEATADGGSSSQGFIGTGGAFAVVGTFRKTVDNSGATRFQGVNLNNSGTVEVLAGAIEIAGDGHYAQTSGVTRLLTGATLRSLAAPLEFAGGSIEGTGTLQGAVTNGGEAHPGLPIGSLMVAGDYTQGASGRLAIEIGGGTAGSGYDTLQVTGGVTLGGALDVSLVNGFLPASGAEFTILSADSIAGAFATANLVIGNGVGFTMSIGPQDVVLRTVVEDCANNVDDDGDGGTDCDDVKCVDAPACGGSTPTSTPTRTPTSTPTVTPTRNPSLPTFTPTPTPTVTPTGGASATPTATGTATPTPSHTPTGVAPCAGDCNSNRVVSIDELARGVDLAERSASSATCRAIDADDNDRVSIDEIIAAVNEALAGCR